MGIIGQRRNTRKTSGNWRRNLKRCSEKFWIEDCERYRKLDTANNCPCFKILENNSKKEN